MNKSFSLTKQDILLEDKEFPLTNHSILLKYDSILMMNKARPLT
jgi:hypothetical protein